MGQSREGGCLCNAVRYRVVGECTANVLCHCESCRKASGAPSVAWSVFRSADFSYIQGAPVQFRSSPQVIRTFCGACGTPLTYQTESRLDMVDVTTVSLDDPAAFAPTKEIWVEDKVRWETLDPALPHHPRSSVGGDPS